MDLIKQKSIKLSKAAAPIMQHVYIKTMTNIVM